MEYTCLWFALMVCVLFDVMVDVMLDGFQPYKEILMYQSKKTDFTVDPIWWDSLRLAMIYIAKVNMKGLLINLYFGLKSVSKELPNFSSKLYVIWHVCHCFDIFSYQDSPIKAAMLQLLKSSDYGKPVLGSNIFTSYNVLNLYNNYCDM